ncbi:MAG: hypothetical protein HYT12_00740 [Candidatus Liptonbacteria bacterium]|nr:hypothetical protein [Candidatus Liptonbacteria bacterium]
MTAYEKYLELLRKLDQLIANGKCEFEEAEKINGEMDELWWKMTEKQRLEINKNIRLPKRP